LEDIIVFHTEHGKDSFLDIKGSWNPCCFGIEVSACLKLLQPIRSYSVEQIKAFHESQVSPVGSFASGLSTDSSVESVNLVDIKTQSPLPPSPLKDKTLSIPKELWRLTDFVYKYGMDVDNLFLTSGNPATSAYMRTCLDVGNEFDIEALFTLGDNTASAIPPLGREVAVLSASENILMWLKSLPTALISPAVQKQCIECTTLHQASKVIQKLNKPNYFTFLYFVSFLKEVKANYLGQGLTLQRMCDTFSSAMFQGKATEVPTVLVPAASSLRGYLFGAKVEAGIPESAWNEKRSAFLKLFIEGASVI
jgi:RhoGAP domain